MLDRCTDFSYKWTAVSPKDNPPILSGKPAHGGVALFWKISVDDLVTPLENIDSDRIVGIRCDFADSDPLFILRTIVPFVTAHLEIFHCTHHPVIPKSDLYFTFCSTLNALSKRTSK